MSLLKAPINTPVWIDITRCKACDICVSACPAGVLSMRQEPSSTLGAIIDIVALDSCIGCGECELHCPDFAIHTGGVSMQMEDEIASICSVIGASMSGKRAMTATSGPGLSLKAENLGLAHMAEVPLVCIDVMRGGPSTGLPTRVAQGDVSQVKHPSHGDLKSITVSPGNLLECYTEVARAFN
ncbi:hypothetical protein ADUPG1_003314, partial [Aduncisulcus paluster]